MTVPSEVAEAFREAQDRIRRSVKDYLVEETPHWKMLLRPGSNGPNGTILFICEHPGIRYSLTKWVERQGYRVTKMASHADEERSYLERNTLIISPSSPRS